MGSRIVQPTGDNLYTLAIQGVTESDIKGSMRGGYIMMLIQISIDQDIHYCIVYDSR